MRLTMLSVALLALLTGIPALAAVTFMEDWSDDGDIEGWKATSPNVAVTLTHDDLNDTLDFSAPNGYGSAQIIANGTASGGAFIGNYLAAGAQFFEYDIYFDSLTDLANYRTQLLGPGGTWRTANITGAGISRGVWHHTFVSLNPVNWTYVSGGTGVLNDTLANVTSVRIRIGEGSEQAGIDGQLDNFLLQTPEPGTFALVGLGVLGLVAWRRRRTS